MTVPKQKQLDYLVEHYSCWDFGAESCTVKEGPAWSGNEVKPSPLYAVFLTDDSGDITYEEWSAARERKQKELSQPRDNSWHGRGELPPIGTICEAYHSEDGWWYEAEVLKTKRNEAGRMIVAVVALDSQYLYWSGMCRPIISEREKAIEDMVEVMMGTGRANLAINAAALYDAGYHK